MSYYREDWESGEMSLGWRVFCWFCAEALPWGLVLLITGVITAILLNLFTAVTARADVVIIPSDDDPYPTICTEYGGVTICN